MFALNVFRLGSAEGERAVIVEAMTPPPLFAMAATSFGKSVCDSPFYGGSSDFQSKSSDSVAPASIAASSSSSVCGLGPRPMTRWRAVKLIRQA